MNFHPFGDKILIVSPEKQLSKNSKIHRVLVAMTALTISVSVNSAPMDEQGFSEIDYYLLLHLKQAYSEEIFDYCVNKHGPVGYKMQSCMIRNDKLKRKVFADAQDQLGRQSLAQGIYNECLDYYPMQAVARIVRCVETRLVLNSKLKDSTVEKKIYEKCDFKWRKHGALAIDNCARTDASYYRDKGVLRK